MKVYEVNINEGVIPLQPDSVWHTKAKAINRAKKLISKESEKYDNELTRIVSECIQTRHIYDINLSHETEIIMPDNEYGNNRWRYKLDSFVIWLKHGAHLSYSIYIREIEIDE